MPVQQQMSSFAKRLGRRVAEANAEHAAKPVDTGKRRLPGGIRDGVARLSSMYTKEYDGGDLAGEIFFRASGSVIFPHEFRGEKVAGMVTSVMIPLCDIPAKGDRKAKSFSDNWFEFQNLFKLFGVKPCPETPETDPTGERTQAYFFAAMAALTDASRMKTNPVYFTFSTRGWTPPPTPTNPRPEEMVFETWHELATPEQVARAFGGGAVPNPAAGVVVAPPRLPSAPPPPPAPSPNGRGAAAPPPTNDRNESPGPQGQPRESLGDEERAELVSALVEAAMADADSPDGMEATKQLEEMAWANGWTKEDTLNAADWAAVGGMALSALGEDGEASAEAEPTVGSRWLFTKRSRDGAKLRNSAGEEFPGAEVEVVSVDAASRTCTLKMAADGKNVVDVRTKKPTQVKWEWLEKLPY